MYSWLAAYKGPFGSAKHWCWDFLKKFWCRDLSVCVGGLLLWLIQRSWPGPVLIILVLESRSKQPWIHRAKFFESGVFKELGRSCWTAWIGPIEKVLFPWPKWRNKILLNVRVYLPQPSGFGYSMRSCFQEIHGDGAIRSVIKPVGSSGGYSLGLSLGFYGFHILF